MEKPFTVIFGAVIAYILLLLYAGTVGYMILEVLAACGGNGACAEVSFSDGVVYVTTTVGGLVSALVISKLAITKRGENPATLPVAGASRKQALAVNTLGVLYLTAWLVVGLVALVVGVMLHPEVSQTVSDIGTSWLGLAIASGYAYFALDPS